MTIVEDKGLKEIFETDIEINIELIEDTKYNYEKNNILIVPINNKTNLVEIKYLSYKEFKYNKIIEGNNNIDNIFVVIIVSMILSLVIAIAIFCYLRYKKRIKIDDMNQGSLLNEVETHDY